MRTQKNIKSTLTSIKNHLIKCGCDFDHNSDKSNSIYLKLAGSVVRVSDHFGPLACKGVQIVTSLNDKFTVVIHGGVLVYDKMGEVKSFMKNYCEMELCKDFVNMNLVSEKVEQQKHKLEYLNEEIKKTNGEYVKIRSQYESASKKMANMESLKFDEDTIVDISAFTTKQKQNVSNLLNAYAKQLANNPPKKDR